MAVFNGCRGILESCDEPHGLGRRGKEGLGLARIASGANEECKYAGGLERPVYSTKDAPFDLLLCAVLFIGIRSRVSTDFNSLHIHEMAVTIVVDLPTRSIAV